MKEFEHGESLQSSDEGTETTFNEPYLKKTRELMDFLMKQLETQSRQIESTTDRIVEVYAVGDGNPQGIKQSPPKTRREEENQRKPKKDRSQ